MRPSKTGKILSVAVFLLILFIAGCAVKTEESKVQKKPSKEAQFNGYVQVGWSPDGKRIYTVESYGKAMKLDFRLYSEKTDISDKKLLQHGLSRWDFARIAVSPNGRYVMYAYTRGPVTFNLAVAQEAFLEIIDVKTRKVVTKMQIPVPYRFGWKDNKTAWYTTYKNTGTFHGEVTYTIQVGSSKSTELVKGNGLAWSSDKRYFVYVVQTTGLNLLTSENLFVLDTKTNASSNILKSSDSSTGESTGEVVLNGNKLYYVFYHHNHADVSVDIDVIDISTKKSKVLWSKQHPAGPDVVNMATTPPTPVELHSISVNRLFLDRSKKFLLFDLMFGGNEREPQTSVYKLAIDGKNQPQKVASMQATMQENNTLDYCSANNTILWIDKRKTIKTKRLD